LLQIEFACMPPRYSHHIDLNINTAPRTCIHLQKDQHRTRHVKSLQQTTRSAVNFPQENLMVVPDMPDKPGGGRVVGGSGRVSPTEFREALSTLASTVTVVTTGGPHGFAGVTCSAFCTVSDSPPTILVCISRKSAANRLLKANRVLCVNALCETQIDLSDLFSGVGQVPMAERFADKSWRRLQTSSPHCGNAVAAFDCVISDVREIGTHSIFFAEVLATTRSAHRVPLVHCRRSYATTRTIT
jgi:flavin reductase (NADH)/flavin reductase/chlorophenol-4-monooxygenase component 1